MSPEPHPPSAPKWVLPSVVAVLAATVVLGWVTLSSERTRTQELASRNAALVNSLTRVQTQLDSVTQRLANLNEAVRTIQSAQPPPTPAESAPPEKPVRPTSLRRIASAKPAAPATDPRVDQIQTRLAGQEKELASTRDQLAATNNQLSQTRQDLEGRLGATRDELSTSIARTHEEVVALQRLGERNYYEFTIYKNKDFSRVGPIGLSLRKADTKRRSYQLRFRVDDQEMEKKNVNLFEPILISAGGDQQPLQLVVNEIAKDRIRGYVSEPRQKRPALARSSQAPAGLQVRP